jgi:hypothetical protein
MSLVKTTEKLKEVPALRKPEKKGKSIEKTPAVTASKMKGKLPLTAYQSSDSEDDACSSSSESSGESSAYETDSPSPSSAKKKKRTKKESSSESDASTGSDSSDEDVPPPAKKAIKTNPKKKKKAQTVSSSGSDEDEEPVPRKTAIKPVSKKKSVKKLSSELMKSSDDDSDFEIEEPTPKNLNKVASNGVKIAIKKVAAKLAERIIEKEKRALEKREKAVAAAEANNKEKAKAKDSQVKLALEKERKKQKELLRELLKTKKDLAKKEAIIEDSDIQETYGNTSVSKRTVKYIRDDYGYTDAPAKKQTGVPSQPIYFNHVLYKKREYTVLEIPYKNDVRYAVIDRSKFDAFAENPWHYRSSGGYFATPYKLRGQLVPWYLHNFVTDRDAFAGKGHVETVDHISRIGGDNRLCNLRLASQSEQNQNRQRRARKWQPPTNCGFTMAQVPENINPNIEGGREVRWMIELTGIKGLTSVDGIPVNKNGELRHKCTGNNELDLIVRLKCAILKLREWYDKYPQLRSVIKFEDGIEKINKLRKEYGEILQASCFKKNKIAQHIPEILRGEDDLVLTKKQEDQLARALLMKPGAKKLPKSAADAAAIKKAYGGKDQIKYTRFKEGNDDRGSHFIIERGHPGLKILGKRQWTTSSSKKVSTADKLKQLEKKLKELNDVAESSVEI